MPKIVRNFLCGMVVALSLAGCGDNIEGKIRKCQFDGIENKIKEVKDEKEQNYLWNLLSIYQYKQQICDLAAQKDLTQHLDKGMIKLYRGIRLDAAHIMESKPDCSDELYRMGFVTLGEPLEYYQNDTPENAVRVFFNAFMRGDEKTAVRLVDSRSIFLKRDATLHSASPRPQPSNAKYWFILDRETVRMTTDGLIKSFGLKPAYLEHFGYGRGESFDFVSLGLYGDSGNSTHFMRLKLIEAKADAPCNSERKKDEEPIRWVIVN